MTAIAIIFLAIWLNQQAPQPDVAKSIVVRGKVVNAQGEPIPGVSVLAVQKTWPNNFYRQQMLKTTTDKQGQFQFEDFSTPGKQYAFLLTVISDQWLMTSVYRVVEDGSQQDPIVLRTDKSAPVTIQFAGADGKPVTNVRALPTRRSLNDGSYHLSYEHHVWTSGVPVDQTGAVRFASWKPGEKASIVYLLGDEVQTSEFSIPENRLVIVTVQTPTPTGPPIHVEGQVVDSVGKPVSHVHVRAIQKTWPQNRYRQNALSTKTDSQGRFRFEKFSTAGSRYAFLLTVIADGYAMTSEYQFVQDGSQSKPVMLKLEQSEPVIFVVKDAAGNTLEGVELSPAARKIDDARQFLNYSEHSKDTAKVTNAKGEASLTAWKPGESGMVFYVNKEQAGQLEFKVMDSRRVTLTLTEK